MFPLLLVEDDQTIGAVLEPSLRMHGYQVCWVTAGVAAVAEAGRSEYDLVLLDLGLLGHEPERYYELAAADARAEPGPVNPAIGDRGTTVSAPLLPTAPAGSDDDEAHGMDRMLGAMPSVRWNSVNRDDPANMALRMISRLHRSPTISSVRAAGQFSRYGILPNAARRNKFEE